MGLNLLLTLMARINFSVKKDLINKELIVLYDSIQDLIG